MIALVLGSTGAVGKALVAELTSNSSFDEVRAITRRQYEFKNNSAKLVQKIVDFDALEKHEKDLKGADVLFVAMGTTRASAGSAENFLKIDQELTVAATKAAITSGKDQKILYVSSSGASTSSPFLYPKSKAATETKLRELGAKTTIVFRPGLLELNDEREESRVGEAIARAIIPRLRLFGLKSLSSNVTEIARAMRVVAEDNSKLENHILGNADILRLSALSSS